MNTRGFVLLKNMQIVREQTHEEIIFWKNGNNGP
jgi:hypothetical protein